MEYHLEITWKQFQTEYGMLDRISMSFTIGLLYCIAK